MGSSGIFGSVSLWCGPAMNFRVRTMTSDDLPAGMSLKASAGWNQTEADWRRFLNADPAGSFVAEAGGQIIGTVATIRYEGHLAWIGMMLVDPEHRRKGVGEALMRAALGYLEACGVASVGLDATPMGRPLYERLGFVADSGLKRWSLERNFIVIDKSKAAAADVGDSTRIDPDFICELDRAAFGADRSGLIRSFVEESPKRVAACHDFSGPGPAVLIARPGVFADHFAAWLAPTVETAARVLDIGLAQRSRPVVIADVPDEHPWAGALLMSRGFRVARELTRMYLATGHVPAAPIAHAAILGPEFG